MEILQKARTKWLLAEELLYVLNNWQSLNMTTLDAPVQCPSSGTLVLYDKRTVRNFRRDGLGWRRKKLPGKENVIEETHTSLKCAGVVALTSYRTYLPDTPTFGRRIYWKADKSSPFVLVHYLNENIDPNPATPSKRRNLKVVTGYSADGTPITSPVGAEGRTGKGTSKSGGGRGRGRGGAAGLGAGSSTVKYRRQNKKATAAAALSAVKNSSTRQDSFNLSNLTMSSADELFSPPSTPSAAHRLGSPADFSDLVKDMTGLDSVLANLTMAGASGAASAPASVAHSPRGFREPRAPTFGELTNAFHAAGLPPSPPQPRSREGAPPLPPTAANGKLPGAAGPGAPAGASAGTAAANNSAPASWSLGFPPPPASSVYKHRPLGPSHSVPNSPAHSPPASTPSPPTAPPRPSSDSGHPSSSPADAVTSPDFQIVTCAPVSDYETGGATIIVAGRFPENTPVLAYFGSIPVETTLTLPNVLKVVTPPHAPGTVALTLVATDNSVRSNPFEFHYKVASTQHDMGEALFRSRTIDRLARIQAAAGLPENARALMSSPSPNTLQADLCSHLHALLQAVRDSHSLSIESFHQEIMGVDPDTGLSLQDYARRSNLPEVVRLLDQVLSMSSDPAHPSAAAAAAHAQAQAQHAHAQAQHAQAQHAQAQQAQAHAQQQQQAQQHSQQHQLLAHQPPRQPLFGGSVILSEDMAPPPRTQSAPPQFLHHPQPQDHNPLSIPPGDMSSFLGSWGASPPTPVEPGMIVPPSSPVRETSFFDDIMSTAHPGQLNPQDVERALLALESKELDHGSSSPEAGQPPEQPTEADAATEAMMRMSFTAASAPATPIIADLRDPHSGFTVDSISSMLDGFPAAPNPSMDMYQSDLASALSNQLAASQADQAATRIQALYRGYRTRRDLASRYHRPADAAPSPAVSMAPGPVIPPTHGVVAFPTSV